MVGKEEKLMLIKTAQCMALARTISSVDETTSRLGCSRGPPLLLDAVRDSKTTIHLRKVGVGTLQLQATDVPTGSHLRQRGVREASSGRPLAYGAPRREGRERRACGLAALPLLG